jgi:hypothetical protein
MTTQEKVLYIIELLELSDRQVSAVIGKAISTVTHKRAQIGRNKFIDEDLKKLKDYYIETLNKIKSI